MKINIFWYFDLEKKKILKIKNSRGDLTDTSAKKTTS